MTKKIYLLIFLTFFVFYAKVNAQNNLPPVFEIKADTALNQVIDDKYWQLLEDPSGNLSIDQVSSPGYDDKFHINTTKTKGYDYNITTYWLRYQFKNTTPHPIKFTVAEGVAYAWIYKLKRNNTWDVKKTGELVPYSQRDGLKSIKSLVFTLNPGEVTLFYERNIFDFRLYKPKDFTVSIGFADRVIKTNYINNEEWYSKSILTSILFGVLLMALVINLLFYNVVREKTYLFFSSFLLFCGLALFNSSTDFMLLEYPLFRFIFTGLLFAGTFYSIMHFIRYYLDTKHYTPKWDKFLIILSILQIFPWFANFLLASTLSYKLYLIVSILFSIITYSYFPVILITIIVYFWINKKSRVAIIAIFPSTFWLGIVYGYIFIVAVLYQYYPKIDTKLASWAKSFDASAKLIIFLWLTVVFSWILFNRFQKLQKSLVDKEIERNQLIEQQKVTLENEVEARTAELKQSLSELKTTQQQLIQSEKLASLGELTAGIAHEIQNPLNFVNNFSEVNKELLEEIKLEREKNIGDRNDALENEIIADLVANEEKIIYHGKRADAIVKNMLQHSRNNSAEKQLTDINALADEYFRLSYHGLRAKDKSFNSGMSTDLDPSLPMVNIISQDVGRVLLNLFNNSFYAVQQRKKKEGENYKPEVKVSTFADSDFIKIKVTDNGTGISDVVKSKILQPFFTTKPTGEGTGLGLSLSYDIITKGHGGKIDIDSREGEFTEFTISIPK
jgi:signal transduction histidine kinase